MVKVSKISVSKVLGKGSFGTVYEAVRLSDGLKCAAKVALIEKRTDPLSILSESLLGMLTSSQPHPRIVPFYGLGKRENEDKGDHHFEVVLLMELVPGGSLLHAMKGEPFVERRARKFVCQVLEGLFHLHLNLKIIHRFGMMIASLRCRLMVGNCVRPLKGLTQSISPLSNQTETRWSCRDIKPGNVLLTSEDNVKIADLGGSIFVEDGNADTFTGTPFYMAPEVLKRESYTNKVDVFSTGCLLVHMLTGKVPFLNSHVNELTYLYKMRNDDLILDVPNGPWQTQRMNHFISCMVEIDPSMVTCRSPPLPVPSYLCAFSCGPW
jgi:serine/threonine protein kinase